MKNNLLKLFFLFIFWCKKNKILQNLKFKNLFYYLIKLNKN